MGAASLLLPREDVDLEFGVGPFHFGEGLFDGLVAGEENTEAAGSADFGLAEEPDVDILFGKDVLEAGEADGVRISFDDNGF